MSTIHVVCPHCHKVNRIPVKDHYNKANCGYCHQSLLDTHPIELTPETFNIHIQKSDIPVVVDFWAPWCGPCKAIGPVVTELADEFSGKVRIAKMNVDESPATPGKYGIRAIPTLILFKDGEVLDQVTGAVGKAQLAAMLEKA